MRRERGDHLQLLLFKTELTTATAELFFKRAFFEEFCHPSNGERYLDYCVRMFESMVKTLEHFRIHWLKGADSLPAAEKAAAHLREEKVSATFATA